MRRSSMPRRGPNSTHRQSNTSSSNSIRSSTGRLKQSIWQDPNYPLYYKNIYTYQLDAYKKAGTIADKDYDLDDFFQAKKLWEEMNAQKTKYDDLAAKVATAGNVSDDRKKLLDEAKSQYDGYNFLDAVRFLQAALA